MRDPPGDLLVLEPYGERGAHPVLFCRAKGPSPDGGAHVVSCDREVMPWLDDDDGYAGAIVRVWAGKETQRPGRCGRRGSSPGKPRDRVAARLLHGCRTPAILEGAADTGIRILQVIPRWAMLVSNQRLEPATSAVSKRS